VFCGVGGWSKAFGERGWKCTGVDLEDFSAEWIEAGILRENA